MMPIYLQQDFPHQTNQLIQYISYHMSSSRELDLRSTKKFCVYSCAELYLREKHCTRCTLPGTASGHTAVIRCTYLATSKTDDVG